MMTTPERLAMDTWDPPIVSDADIEQAQLEAAGRRLSALQQQGVCVHGSVVGYRQPPIYPEQEDLQPGQVACTGGCGRVFESDEAWLAAIAELV
jgi:hypothetical protein